MDRKTQTLVEQYADSLSQVALEKGLVSEIQEELSTYLTVFKETQLSSYLSNLALAREDKVSLVRSLEEFSSHYLKNFFEVILLNERERLIEPIFQAVSDKLVQATREFPVTVTTAVPLTQEQKERILKLSHQKFEINARDIIEELDDAIIGGFVLKANNKIIDTSIRSQLQQLKNNLK
ncbi:F0F1 ATP synthase subunit delta [Streptococcus tangpeifui]|uniref:F0F1 ATP synthase subunit delta n=1 Tax=Streptococcus tangpeifui TaxID=2709400 RepID=UPI0013EA454E|nr:F0F1 ATP synthase subunit delta [Streptococcus sp. ZJ373]